MHIEKIVITGGPCAGKSTALSWIQNAFTEKGYRVLFVPETATELISGGVAPWTCGTNLEYQKCQMSLQIHKEMLFEQAAATMDTDKVLIVCDRGAMDNKAYMSDEEFQAVMDHLGVNEVQLRDSYHAVFHLVTAAKGAADFYTTANNAARYESPEEAIDVDNRLLAAWTGHRHLRVIDNTTGFEEKMLRLITEISTSLGESNPHEIERKFLIRYPDIAALEANPNCRRVEIIQTYLKTEPGHEHRIRQRGSDGHYIYYETFSRTVAGHKKIELENRLNKEEYLKLLMDADAELYSIHKTRYCLTENSLYFEIDVFPFWKDQAILEVELSDENQKIVFPEMLEIIREVTDDPNYKNMALARIY